MAPKKASAKKAPAGSETFRDWEDAEDPPHDNDGEDDDDGVGHAMNKKPSAKCRKRPAADDAEGPTVKRDRNKNYHFQNQLKKLPDYVQTMYANGTCREKKCAHQYHHGTRRRTTRNGGQMGGEVHVRGLACVLCRLSFCFTLMHTLVSCTCEHTPVNIHL